MMKKTAHSGSHGGGGASMIMNLTRRRRFWMLLLLPTFLAVATLIARSLTHLQDGASSSSMEHQALQVPHRLTSSRESAAYNVPDHKNDKKETPKSSSSSSKRILSPKKNQHDHENKRGLLRNNNNNNKIPTTMASSYDSILPFQPTRRDLHIGISSGHKAVVVDNYQRYQHHVHRHLAVDDPAACDLPLDTCDYIYTSAGNRLAKVNIITGDEIDVGSIGFDLSGGLAMDVTTKRLYGISNTGNLATIDPCTGAGTVVGAITAGGPTLARMHSLAIDSTGKLFAWDDTRLYRINKGNGRATPLGNAGIRAQTLCVDDCDQLHATAPSNGVYKDHFLVNSTTGEAVRDATIVGALLNGKDYVRGDILPGTKRMFSPLTGGGGGIKMIDLEANEPYGVVPTTKTYDTTAFACDKPNYPDFTFDAQNNATGHGDNQTAPKFFKVYVGPTGKVPKNPPDPNKPKKPRPECADIEQELKDIVEGYTNPKFDTGASVVRYECPNNIDLKKKVPHVYFLYVSVQLHGPGKEIRIKLNVFQHNETDGSTVQIVHSSPVIHTNGLVFFVPLQQGNHTVQLLDGTGQPIQESAECQHANLNVTLHPYYPPTAVPTISPTSSPTEDNSIPKINPNCPLNNETMTPECDKQVSKTWGDPHVITFDNLKFDCQTLGDHVVLKSRKTPLEIHGRYGKPYFREEFLSWFVGVVVREGTPGMPLVEISLDTPFDSKDGSIKSTCDKTIVVDGVKLTQNMTIPTDYSHDVWFKESRNEKGEHIITVSYWSGLIVEVKDRQRPTFGCSLTTLIKVPLYMREEWDLYGLMGSPDGKKSNDWVGPDGQGCPVPGNGRRKVNAMKASGYCRKWCLTKEADSLFDYSGATRHAFNDWENCAVGTIKEKDDVDVAEEEWLKFMDDIENKKPEAITGCAATTAAQAANGNPLFDQDDCIIELFGGAPMEDVIDDQADNLEADLESTGIAACGDQTKNDCSNLYGAEEMLSKKAMEYSIGCCVQAGSLEPVSGVSVVDSATGQCMPKGNYNDALKVCASLPDGRLCTREEMSKSVLKGSQGSDKCDLSKDMVWTSSLPSGKLNVLQWKVCATKDGCANTGGNGKLVDGTDASVKAKAICCSSQALAGWRGSQCGIWSQSQFNGKCSGDVSYEEAVSFCVGNGGSLCTKANLLNDCTKGTPCSGYDGQQVWALDTGVAETPEPEPIDPFEALDAEQKRWLACGDKSVLGCLKDEGAYEIIAAESELHEVRCCKESSSDLTADGWTNNEECPNIWARSHISDIGDGCVHAASYASAESHCQAIGGVVCKKEWVTGGCTKGSGYCKHDTDLIWTSDIVEPSSIVPVPMSWVGCGAKSRCNGYFGKGAKLSPVNATHEVRCCSETEKTGWKKNKKCKVWGGSKLPMCYHAETFESAMSICDLAGARLCTKQELLSDCTKGSGCGHDADFVWTMNKGWDTSFEPDPDTRLTDKKFWLACGDVNKRDCVYTEGTNEHLAPESDEHEFVCCSDEDQTGSSWKVEDLDSCNVMATARLGGRCFEPANYARAKQICSNSGPGGRLCTRAELTGRCAATVAKSCKLDRQLLWTSEGHDESKQGALTEMRWLSCGNKGKCTELHGKGGKMEDHTSANDHEVRCCSDNHIPGWRKKDGCPWTESDINGVCIHANTYQEAIATCNSVGARLCEKDELVRTCTQGSGCSHDWDLIWSKTPAFQPPTEVVKETKAYLACGSKDNGDCVKYEGTKEAISSSLDRHEVRCCSGAQFDSSWVNDPSNSKCTNVFAKSKVPVCYHDASYEEAVDICSKYTDGSGNSGRLCTKQEVLDGCADDSGCEGHNVDLIWTGDQVDEATTTLVEKKWIVCGSRGGCEVDKGAELVDHTDNTVVAGVRCCASHYVAGWMDPVCPGIWSESELPTSDPSLNGECHIVPYYKAESICAGYGARLCTKAELASDCTNGSGCNYNGIMNWSKESGYEVASTQLKASS